MSQSNIVTSLSIGEIYSLESEINGAVNQQTGEKISKGVLAHPLSMIHRYWLTDLVESINIDTYSDLDLANIVALGLKRN